MRGATVDFDFLTGLAEIGSRGGRWKSFTAILFAVLGAALGGYLGFEAEGLRGALTMRLAGAVWEGVAPEHVAALIAYSEFEA